MVCFAGIAIYLLLRFAWVELTHMSMSICSILLGHFGLCIAGMDKKIADRQGYSFVQKFILGGGGHS